MRHLTTRTLSSWPSWYQGMCMPVPILHVFVEPMNPSFYALVTATPHCTPLQHRIQSGAPIGGAQALWHTLTSSSGTTRWIHWNNRILSESPLRAPYEAGLSCSARARLCVTACVLSGRARPCRPWIYLVLPSRTEAVWRISPILLMVEDSDFYIFFIM